MFQIQSGEMTLKAPVLFDIAGLPVTNTMTTGVLTIVVVLVLSAMVSNFRIYNPGKLQLIIESLVIQITNFIEQIAGDNRIAWRIMPIVTAMVGYILISNFLIVVIPFLGAITMNGESLFRPTTSDVNTTFSLAFSMVLLSNIFLISKINITNYLWKFFPIKQVLSSFSKGIGSGILSLVNLFIGILDLVSEVAKVLSLSFRLFGNIFAGEVLLKIFMGLFAIILPVPIMMLSGLASAVQAFVFGALVTSYFASALKSAQE